ncbi:alpha/beta hydrolase [Bradyrhizobium diazoefficiens]|nr:alpha/beta hydrolase [Bradyrhizobium diazoefficiens]MBR0777494.1 alpha/beta hydrolase [Bradyrhizobium diazoefficiens]
MLAPQDRFYESHGLRLHYADWGNHGALPVILVHGGRDHCRSWDLIARSLQPHFHVLAPDLRGHGDSDWTRGGSYALTEYVYDLAQLVRRIAAPQVILIGHSMGGMVSLIFSGAFPEQVSRLVVLDGVTVRPDSPKPPPAHERIAKWIGQLDKLHDRSPRRYSTLEAAAAQMVLHNKRLSRDLALHLATHGARQNEDGTYSWKFDPYQRASAPHRLWSDDHVALWARIACPTLLLNAGESFLAGAKAAGLERYFQQARVETIQGAGHWLQHDKPQEVLGEIQSFLGLPVDVG